MRTTYRVLSSLALTAGIALAGAAATSPASAALSTMTPNRGIWVAKNAARQAGDPYSYGSNGPSSFDCAGLVQYAYKLAGKRIGRTAGDQLRGQPVAWSNARPGDIVVFLNGGYAYHSAVYAGNGYMWEARHTGTVVSLNKIRRANFVVRRPY